MKYIIFALFCANAYAGHGNDHTYACKVMSFDTKDVTLNCGEGKPASAMKTPRTWVIGSVKNNASVQVVIGEKQLDQWLVANNVDLKEFNK